MTPRHRGPRVTAGHFYGRTHDGRLVPIDDPGGRAPDLWICRRLDDFPEGQAPPGAAIASCFRCGAALAYNPARVPTLPVQTPKVCLQCARIVPDPLP